MIWKLKVCNFVPKSELSFINICCDEWIFDALVDLREVPSPCFFLLFYFNILCKPVKKYPHSSNFV